MEKNINSNYLYIRDILTNMLFINKINLGHNGKTLAILKNWFKD